MADRPILFSAPMVRALLDGRKTQTRRALTQFFDIGAQDQIQSHVNVKYAIGDRLWVREAWSAIMTGGWTIADARSRLFREHIVYRADSHAYEDGDGWWPSIHMPREFSRLTLMVTDVRVQRLQDISMADAMAEGCRPFFDTTDPQIMKGPNGTEHSMLPLKGPVADFRTLWNCINGPDAWGANPWVVALTFTVHRCNIDQMGKDNG